VSLSEIKPHVISRTSNLDDIMPADGYEWEGESASLDIGQGTASDDWAKWG